MPSIRFGLEDLDLFRQASHDANPLHMSAEYARRTVFGERVVFGVLGAVAALGELTDRPGQVLATANLTFHGPLFVGTDYAVKVESKRPDRAKVTLHDAGRLMLTASVAFRPGVAAAAPDRGEAPRRECVSRPFAEVVAGLEARGNYAPEPEPFARLLHRWGLLDKGIAPVQVAALLWASFLVGMELPGERATFSKLSLEFPDETPTGEAGGPITYEAKVEEFDDRFDLIQISARLAQRSAALARGEITSYVLRDSPELSLDLLATALPRSEALKGRVALVTGGARGLGAAIVAALASQGAEVIMNYRNGQTEAEALRDRLAAEPGTVTLAPGDARDSAWSDRLINEVKASHGGLDILICNASPPIRPLGLTTDSVDRLRAFINDSVGLVAAPLASALGAIEARTGWAVIISSEFARTTPPEFPHYVAAKLAVEGLIHAAAARRPAKANFLIVRPPRLLTDQTNTATGRSGALGVETVAAALVSRLLEPPPETGPALLEQFPLPEI